MNIGFRCISAAILSGLLASTAACSAQPEGRAEGTSTPGTSVIDINEIDIEELHLSLKESAISCEQIISAHLDNLTKYEAPPYSLNAVITVNKNAIQRAQGLDLLMEDDAFDGRPLHCVPIVVKDNINTHDMPTTSGSILMAGAFPESDALMVAALRAAGAVIVAKTSMHEWANGGTSESSLSGQVLNPYDFSRTPGGSSGGTSAALAANYSVVGLGTDTGNSVRSPASAANLVGLRPTHDLVDRSGVAPNSYLQDDAGPLARTVGDIARVLDVLVQASPNGEVTGEDDVKASLNVSRGS